MKILILETGSQKSFIIFAEDGRLRLTKDLESGPALSRNLAQELDALLLELSWERVDAIYVGQGPGSYTGIRSSAALAKGLAFAWDIPVFGFTSLKAFIPPNTGSFAVLLDARMGGVYALLGERKEEALYEEAPKLYPLDQLPHLLSSIKHIVSPSPKEIQKRGGWQNIKEILPQKEALIESLATSRQRLQLTYLSSPS